MHGVIQNVQYNPTTKDVPVTGEYKISHVGGVVGIQCILPTSCTMTNSYTNRTMVWVRVELGSNVLP